MTNPLESSSHSLPPNTSVTSAAPLSSTSSSSSISSDLVRNALGNLSTSDLPQSTIDRVLRLEIPPEIIHKETTDPVEFFRPLGAKKEHLVFFKRENIQSLQKIIRHHPISKRICFHDLFGMELDRILKNLKPFVKNWDALHQEWAALYFSGYLGLLCEDEDSDQSNARSYARAMGLFTEKLERAVQEKNLEPFQNWKEATGVLRIFLISKGAALMLTRTVPNSSSTDSEEHTSSAVNADLSSHQPDNIHTLKKTVLEPLCHYVEVMKTTYKASTGKSSPILETIYGKLEILLRKSSKDRLLKTSDDLLQYIVSTNDVHRGDHSISMILVLAWLQDIRTILEHDFITKLNPNIVNSHSHINRMFINLLQIIQTIDTINQPNETSLEKKLYTINLKFNDLFNSQQILSAVQSLLDLNKESPFPLFCLMSSHLKLIHDSLKPLIATTLRVFTQEKYSSICDESLTEKTLWFSRILILYHDIGVILRVTSSTADILPASYLEFLARTSSDLSESDTSDFESEEDSETIPKLEIPTQDSLPRESESPKISSKKDSETVPKLEIPQVSYSVLDSPPNFSSYQNTPSSLTTCSSRPKRELAPQEEHEQLSLPQRISQAKERNIPVERIPQKKEAATSGPSQSSSRSESSSSSTGIDPNAAREIRKAKNQRQLKKILKKCGFKHDREGAGSHEILKDSEGNSVTVPRHKKLKRGTLRSMERSITEDERHKSKFLKQD